MTTIGEAVILVRADGSKVKSDIARATAPIKGAGTRAGTGFGRAFAGTAIAYGIAKVVKSSIELEAQYTTTLKRIGIATHAPQRELDRLDQLSQKLGADTVFSANEVADAMLGLAKGGLTTAQIRAGALANTLTLATAGELDLATASDTLVRVMGEFGLSGKDSERVTTALAGAANASSINVSDLAIALSQAGGEAKSAGLSVEETTGVLAAFGQAGLAGSDAGTALRTMLTRLTPVTDKAAAQMDALGLTFEKRNGDFRNISAIADQLQEKFGKMSQSERSAALTTLFGADARRAANVLINQGSEGLAKYITASKDQTQAEKLAAAAMSGTQGALERAKGAWQTAELQLGKGLAPVVADVAEGFSNWLGKRDIEQDATNLVNILKDIGSALEPLVSLVGDAIGLFNDLPGPLKQIAVEGAIAAAVFTKMRTGVAGSWLTGFSTQSGSAATNLAKLSSAARTAAGAGGLVALTQAAGESNDQLQSLETVGGAALLGFAVGGPIGAAIGGGTGALYELGKALGVVGGEADNASPSIADFTSAVDDMGHVVKTQAREIAATALEASAGLVTAGKSAGLSEGSLIDAIVGSPKDMQFAGAHISAAITKATGQVSAAQEAAKSKLEAYQTYLNDKAGPATAEETAQLQNLQAAFDSAGDAQTKRIAGLKQLAKYLGVSNAALRDAVKAERKHDEAVLGADANLKLYDRTLRKLPKKAETAVRALGTDATKKELEGLDKQYDGMDKRDVNTILHALGVDTAKAGIDGVKRSADALDGKTVDIYTIFHRQDIYNATQRAAPYAAPKVSAPSGGGTPHSSSTGASGKTAKITLDVGSGRKLTGWMDQQIDERQAFDNTMSRML